MQQTGLGACDFDTAYMLKAHSLAADIDELGHVNNIVYLRWVQEIAVAHWSIVAPHSLQEAYFFVVLRHEIDYRTPILVDQNVEIRTWLGKAHGPRFDRIVDIRVEGAARYSAKARTTWCMLKKQDGKPQRISKDIFAAFGVEASALN